MTDNQIDYLMNILTEDQVNEFYAYIASHPETTEDRNQTAINALEDAINDSGFYPSKLVKLTNEWNRYSQNQLVKLAIAIIKNAASDNYKYDGRNIWAHRTAKNIVDLIVNYL